MEPDVRSASLDVRSASLVSRCVSTLCAGSATSTDQMNRGQLPRERNFSTPGARRG